MYNLIEPKVAFWISQFGFRCTYQIEVIIRTSLRILEAISGSLLPTSLFFLFLLILPTKWSSYIAYKSSFKVLH